MERQDLTTGVLDNQAAVQPLKVDRRNREEVEGEDRFSVILQKRQPLFPRIAATSDAPQIAGDRAFGNDEAKLLQLAMDLGGAPLRIVFRQAPDQDTNLCGDLRAASAGPGAPTPVEAESGAMPADHGLGLDDNKDLGPTGPATAEGRPEDPIQRVQGRPWTLALERGERLS
jgi:hypothetical protein